MEGKIIIYHAGSLTIPFEAVKKEFEAIHPRVDVKLISGGSVKLARMIAEMGDKVDIFVSADYSVIDSFLVSRYADWNILFAKNSMVIMYTEHSIYAGEINGENWYQILTKEGVNYGHSDPNLDPCGYRTLLTWQLAEKYYKKDGLFRKLRDCCLREHIRPKYVELITLLEAGVLDYAFEYESVARQHMLKNPQFRYLKLPEEINLSSMENAQIYRNASIMIRGREPGDTVIKTGEPIVYSLTMPESGQNREPAFEFLQFLLDRNRGLKILEKNGQPVLDKIIIKGALEEEMLSSLKTNSIKFH